MGLIAGFVASAALASSQYGPPPAPPSVPAPSQAPAAPAEPPASSAAELHAAASCLVARDPAVVNTLLATAPYSGPERTQAVRLLGEMQRCLRRREAMSTSVALVRGALAEAALENSFPAPQAARTPTLGAAALFSAGLATERQDAASLAPAYSLAECTASRHPELVRGLVASEPGSAAAEAAFAALNPAFVSCVTGDTSLEVDGRTLRGILAEDLYRWSVVQRDGPASPWAAPATP